MTISKVTIKVLSEVIENREPRGLFYAEDENGLHIAVDNRTGDAWTEEFDSEKKAVSWLEGNFEVGEDDESEKDEALLYVRLLTERKEMLEAFRAAHENHSMSKCFSCTYHEGNPRDPASPCASCFDDSFDNWECRWQ